MTPEIVNSASNVKTSVGILPEANLIENRTKRASCDIVHVTSGLCNTSDAFLGTFNHGETLDMMDEELEDQEVEPNQEPDTEPSDPHTPPLDDEDDARFLRPDDERRLDIERRRERRFDREGD